MPLSLPRWSLALLIVNLLAPPALAGEEPPGPVARQSQQQPAAKKHAKKKKKKAHPKRLVRIPGGKLLRHDAAAAFERMYAEARDAGLWLRVISGHRSWERQKHLYHLYRKGLGPRAARPGRSNHNHGLAVDISVRDVTTQTYEWLSANACRFGFKRTVRSEPWHWEYRPRTTPAPQPDKDCLGRALVPPAAPRGVAAPSPS